MLRSGRVWIGQVKGRSRSVAAAASQILFSAYVRDICGRNPWPEQTEVRPRYLVHSDFEHFPFPSWRIMQGSIQWG